MTEGMASRRSHSRGQGLLGLLFDLVPLFLPFQRTRCGDEMSAGLLLWWSRGVQQFFLVLILHSLELLVSTSVQFSVEGGPALVLRLAHSSAKRWKRKKRSRGQHFPAKAWLSMLSQ